MKHRYYLAACILGLLGFWGCSGNDLNISMKFTNSCRCSDVNYAASFITTNPCSQYLDLDNVDKLWTWFDDTDSDMITDTYSNIDPVTEVKRGFTLSKQNCGDTDIIVSDGKILKIPVEENYNLVSFVATADMDDDNAVILAHACTPVSVENVAPEVILNEIPYRVDGDYRVISNFDFTSSFERYRFDPNKTAEEWCRQNGTNYSGVSPKICVPQVEDMLAGDWVAFVNDFAREPTATLLEFVWENTIKHLPDAGGDNEKYKEIVNKILGFKGYSLTLVHSKIEETLENEDWYKSFKSISGDIVEFLSNAQFGGEFSDVRIDAQNTISGKASFDDVQFRWSYVAEGGVQKCDYDEYKSFTCNDYLYNGNPAEIKDGDGGGDDSCRKTFLLKDTGANIDNTISGEFLNANLKNSVSCAPSDSALDLFVGNVNFKWATIFYTVIFRNVLPMVFNCNATVLSQCDGEHYEACLAVVNGQYIKSILSRFIFESVVTAFFEYVKDNPVSYEGKAFKDVTTVTEGSGKCEDFLKALLEWTFLSQAVKGESSDSWKLYLYALEGKTGNSLYDTIAAVFNNTALPMLCGSVGDFKYSLNTLDKRLTGDPNDLENYPGVLNNFDFTSENGLQFTASDCPVYTEGTDKVMYMGKQDRSSPVAGAIPSVEESSRSERCEWSFSTPSTEQGVNQNLRGLFHAIRMNEMDFNYCPKGDED